MLHIKKLNKYLVFKTQEEKKVCLVGNAISLKNKTLGKLIDKNDVIVRMNNYVIHPHEKDVGNKTTHWFINNVIREQPINENYLKNIEEIWIRNINQSINLKPINFKSITNIDPGEFENWLFNIKTIKWPTNGIMAIDYCLKRYKPPINIVGFGFSTHIDFNHYDNKMYTDWKWHDLDKERLIINDLESKNLVKRLDA